MTGKHFSSTIISKGRCTKVDVLKLKKHIYVINIGEMTFFMVSCFEDLMGCLANVEIVYKSLANMCTTVWNKNKQPILTHSA